MARTCPSTSRPRHRLRDFDRWRDGTFIGSTTCSVARAVRWRSPSPSHSASVDSQSVDTTSGGEQRGRDNAKNVDGRSAIVVDSMGLLMAVLVMAASVDDGRWPGAAARLDGQLMGKVVRM